MSIREDILDQFGDDAETMLFADGFDDAIIGVGNKFGNQLCAIYDADKVIDILMKEGMDYAEAMDTLILILQELMWVSRLRSSFTK
ncbi:MAG: hypothetical protein EBT07_15235 [Actinobacteria bacterium]|nr:hypothetical protein [Actinomycetota bacterium]